MVRRLLKTLNDVLVVLGQSPIVQDRAISGLALDSRKLVGGELFLAVPGFAVDGRHYITAAEQAGAVAVLADAGDGFTVPEVAGDIPVILVPGLRNRLGTIANLYYRQPSEYLRVVGVTGTNGKTSCCWFIAQLLSLLEQPCAVMGTIGKGVPPQLESCLNTTSDVISLHQYMAELRERDVVSMAIEVSSHGLDQGRVDDVVFEVGVFTNISRDHLDYHKTLDAYVQAKSLLFADGRVRKAVINLDDKYSKQMLSSCSAETEVVTYSAQNSEADIFAESIRLETDGLVADIRTPWGSGKLGTPQLGRFNLQNLMAVVGAVCVQGHPLDRVLRLIPELGTVPGRMQRFGGGSKPLVVVDYAHTPDALHSVLSALREHGADRLSCVFGCGGDRDRGKRPLMTRAALDGADKVVVTSDNPRSEPPAQIIADAIADVEVGSGSLTTIEDRAEAIATTIAKAAVGEIIVVAGKGHEDYQEVQNVRMPFDDREHVTRALDLWRPE